MTLPRRCRHRLGVLTLVGLLTTAGLCTAQAAAAPPPAVDSATHIGPYGLLIQSSHIVSRDNGASVPLDGIFPDLNGRSAWLFGDSTLTVGGLDCDNWATNTMGFSSRDPSNGIGVGFDQSDSTGAPSEVLPLTQHESFYNVAHHTQSFANVPPGCPTPPTQPKDCPLKVSGHCGAEYLPIAGGVVADPPRQRVLIFMSLVWRVRGAEAGCVDGSSAPACPKNIGSAIASWSPTQNPQMERLYFTNTGRSPTPNPYVLGEGSADTNDPGSQPGTPYNGPLYQTAPVIQGSYVYVYDTVQTGCPWCMRLARVPLATLTDLSTWRFYNGSNPSNPWTPNIFAATSVTSGGPGQMSVTYNPYLGNYVLFYERPNLQSIGYRVAANPWGPWSDEGVLPLSQPQAFNYSAQAHDEFSQQNGKVMYLSYTSAGTGQGIMTLKIVFP